MNAGLARYLISNPSTRVGRGVDVLDHQLRMAGKRPLSDVQPVPASSEKRTWLFAADGVLNGVDSGLSALSSADCKGTVDASSRMVGRLALCNVAVMQRHFTRLATRLFLLRLCFAPAAACRFGYERIVFDERPTVVGLQNVEVVYGQFSNGTGAVEDLTLPGTARTLVGFVQAEGDITVPVYAVVSSCTESFASRLDIKRAYLVGQWTILAGGHRAVLAASYYDATETWFFR